MHVNMVISSINTKKKQHTYVYSVKYDVTIPPSAILALLGVKHVLYVYLVFVRGLKGFGGKHEIIPQNIL